VARIGSGPAGLAFKLSEEVAKSWRRIRAPEKGRRSDCRGTIYSDEIAVTEQPTGTATGRRLIQL
jgi:hypothetical protein